MVTIDFLGANKTLASVRTQFPMISTERIPYWYVHFTFCIVHVFILRSLCTILSGDTRLGEETSEELKGVFLTKVISQRNRRMTVAFKVRNTHKFCVFVTIKVSGIVPRTGRSRRVLSKLVLVSDPSGLKKCNALC